jgi:hypothetical protein
VQIEPHDEERRLREIYVPNTKVGLVIGKVRSISHWFPYDPVGVVNAIS